MAYGGGVGTVVAEAATSSVAPVLSLIPHYNTLTFII